ncbi:MAG: metallophosphoesterase [Pirellulales bacterium]
MKPAAFRPQPLPTSLGYRSALSLLLLAMAGVACLAPLVFHQVAERVGELLILGAIIELLHGFRRSSAEDQRAAWTGGAMTLGMGALLSSAPALTGSAVTLFLAGWFALDALRNLIEGASRTWRGEFSWPLWTAAAGNALIAVAILAFRDSAATWLIAVVGGVRLFGVASGIALSAVFTARDSGATAVKSLQLTDLPEVEELAQQISEEEAARVRADWGWISAFLLTLLAIHVGRMGFDRTLFGLVSPGFAVLGDALLGLVIAYAVAVPALFVWRRATHRLERVAWRWCLATDSAQRDWLRRAARRVLVWRLRFTIRFVQARYSIRGALSRGLQIGLPAAAVIAATTPMWGMSWYFDTENWAAGIWNSWAEERTDVWRAAMVEAIVEEAPTRPAEEAFAVAPPGVPAQEDFSFLVIGDTGEGDASQHSLRASFLEVVRRPDVKFVVLSSDVVYPTGAMKDYEQKFWLPFMGTTKPIYAIPGNHDWYDALDGFTATFLTPDAARRSLRARVDADHGLSSTTDARIDELIATASRHQAYYQVPVQRQEAPFFQFQTADFALVVVDTGVAKRIDDVQRRWLEAALAAARGKTKMAILGHPLYAGGAYQADGNADFAELHQLLQRHEVAVVMAGDTHDLEYYVERTGERETLHFVNGGGGAYLSYGTSLAWPASPAAETWAYYPSRSLVEQKIDATTPVWKRPAWWWTKRWNAWPFSAEWLSAAFDVNTAPFHQSFVEVRVERSRSRLRFIPYGVQGRLRWSDFDASASARPAPAQAEVEWSLPLAPVGQASSLSRAKLPAGT